MEILTSLQKFDRQSAVTIGVFDGVHAGHQKLLKQLHDVAEPNSLARVVVTFDVHPLSVIAPGHAPKMLLTLERKLELLEQSELVDAVVVITFDAVRAAQSAQDFVVEVLVEQLNSRHVLAGSNFVFGHARRGNLAMLKEMGQTNNFKVDPIELVVNESESPISSTLIRQYISVGNIEKANELLTREHELEGIVGHGDKVGTDLGFPTANMEVDDSMCVPADGVYGGHVLVESGEIYLSAISVGVRPMFHEDNIRVIEPHIIDFSADIYGQKLKIGFHNKLRDQLVLGSVEALVEQIGLDVRKVRDSVPQ